MTIQCPKCKAENPDTKQFCGDCGTQITPAKETPVPTQTIEAPREELATGSTFAGRYQIIEELGKGGMGRVYKATDTKIHEKLALKLIKPEIASDKRTLERFGNELKIARKIIHKNVGRMYDINEEKGTHYITMEYVSGQDLKGLIRQSGRLAIETTLSIAKQICEGLSEAHKTGVMHRDLKPSNIMIDREGNVRIMDFGIARSLKEKGITGAGVMIGTPEYMSPEQVEGKEVDQRSDIYSLGVILYEMVTGRVPFEGDTPFTIGVKHKGEMPQNPKELNTQISDDLSRVILRCLEKDKEKRYQNAGEVRSELENIEKGIPTTERKIPKEKPLTSREITVTFNPKKLLIPVLVVVFLIAAGVFFWRFIPKKETVPSVTGDKLSIAILYFENNSGKETLAHWRSGLSEMLITDLSQSKFLHILSSDRIYSLMDKLNLLEKEKYSTEDLKRVASQGGVSHVIRGSFIIAGEKFIINTSLMNGQTTEVISTIREEGTGEASITDSLDKISQHIKQDLDLSQEQISTDLDKELSRITTRSPEAYKYYSQGVNLHNKGRYRESIPLYERAIRIDPEFALAYRNLGTVYLNLGLAPKGREYLEKAMELKDRLSDRERLLIEGSYYDDFENTYQKAMATYENLLEIYPNDTTASNALAYLYYNLENWDKAVSYYEKAKKAGTEIVETYTQLAYCYRVLGEYDRAKQVLKVCLETMGDASGIHRGLSNYYMFFGEYDLALSEIEKALSLDPTNIWNINTQATVYLSQNDLKKAENTYWELKKLTEPGATYFACYGLFSLALIRGKYKEAQSWLQQGLNLALEENVKWVESGLQIDLAYVHAQNGHYEEALKECQLAWENAQKANLFRFEFQRLALEMKGLVQLAHHSIKEAQNTAQELKEFIDSGIHKKSIRLYYHLMGRIELEKGNYPQAVELIQKALSLTSFQRDEMFIEYLGLSYYKAGDLNNALKQYEKIISLTPGNTFYGDIYSKSFYMAGKISQEQRRSAKAIENYEKFLDLLKDADPGIAEVEDARERLAGLKTEYP